MDIYMQKTSSRELEKDYGDLLKDPGSRRLVDNLAMAKWVSEANLDREELIKRGIIEKRDIMLFRFCSLVIETIRIQHEIDIQEEIAKRMSYGLGHLSEFRGISEEDHARIVYCSDENLEPLIDMLKRRNSNVQLAYSLRVAHEYYSGKTTGDIEEEFPLVIDCVGILDNYEGEVSSELLKDNLGELLPLLEDEDYEEIMEGYSEYINRE
jgi:hypothetical protein